MDMNTATPPKKGLKTRPYSMDMNKDTVTLPKKGLKTRPYSMDMNKDIATLPKKGLKTRPYSMDMNKDIATLPKKGLKTRPYNIGKEKMYLKTRPYSIDMENKDLKKLTKGQLIKLLLKQKKSKKVSNHEDLLGNGHLRMKLHKSLQNALNQLHHRELENGKV